MLGDVNCRICLEIGFNIVIKKKILERKKKSVNNK